MTIFFLSCCLFVLSILVTMLRIVSKLIGDEYLQKKKDIGD